MHAEHLSHALTELENRDEFIGRHIGPGEHAIAAMLASIGTDSLRCSRSQCSTSSPDCSGSIQSSRKTSKLSRPTSRFRSRALA